MQKALLTKTICTLTFFIVTNLQFAHAQTRTTTTTATPAPKVISPQVSRFGLAIPVKLENANQIAAYIQQVLDIKIPAWYEYPSYIKQSATYEDALKELGRRYPQYYEKGGNELYAAISKNPIMYQEVIIENRAIREVFPHGNTATNNH